MLSKTLEAAMDAEFKECTEEYSWDMPIELYEFAKTLIRENDVKQSDIAPHILNEDLRQETVEDIIHNLIVNSGYVKPDPRFPGDAYPEGKFLQVGKWHLDGMDFGRFRYTFTPETITRVGRGGLPDITRPISKKSLAVARGEVVEEKEKIQQSSVNR